MSRPLDKYTQRQADLMLNPKTWLITGCAGFIGSNLLETLLNLNQRVIGLDNFHTGLTSNLAEVKHAVPPALWSQFTFIEGDIRDEATCHRIMNNVDYVLHHAALTSVPASIDDPQLTKAINIVGTRHLLHAAAQHNVTKFIIASSSAIYGDSPTLPKVETLAPDCKSPYAQSKWQNEQDAANTEGLDCVSLRYFNIFGRRQNPRSQYGAVIPNWYQALICAEPIIMYGDGLTTRDFCYVDNVVQANILAAVTPNLQTNPIYNIAMGRATSLNDLLLLIKQQLQSQYPHVATQMPQYHDFRPGDVKYSVADIHRVIDELGYAPVYSVDDGLKMATAWYVSHI